jgi:hypothetical protein
VAAAATPPVTSAPTKATATSPTQRRLGILASRRDLSARPGRVAARSSASASDWPGGALPAR